MHFLVARGRYFCESIGMNTTHIRQRIEQVRREMASLGPMRPGSLSEQYNVCGTPGCRCKDPKKPKKHGPYYHLNYTWDGKARTRFVKGADVEEVRQEIETYKRFRALTDEWVDLELARVQSEREH